MKAFTLAALFFTLGSAPAHAADPILTREFAAKAIQLSVTCTQAESPHAYEFYTDGQPTGKARERHPAFFGCYDWHSAVHGHWAMMRGLDRFPDLPESKAAVAILNEHLTKENIEKELSFFKAQKITPFERPYGWAWFLRLSQEASVSKHPDAHKWRLALSPLEDYLVAASVEYLNKLNRPVRAGTHANTALALTHLWDYAQARGQSALYETVATRAKQLYGNDRLCPLDYEPSSGDFISPCFTEADLMRRVLPESEYRRWLNAFLPLVKDSQLMPVAPEDTKDYTLGHMVGFMYQKAAAIDGVLAAMPPKDPRRPRLEKGMKALADKAGPLMFESGYGGTHWIASFALFYYDRAGIGAKPESAAAATTDGGLPTTVVAPSLKPAPGVPAASAPAPAYVPPAAPAPTPAPAASAPATPAPAPAPAPAKPVYKPTPWPTVKP